MSRGPGSMMRAALALLSEDESVDAYMVAVYARHQREGCGEAHGCGCADDGCDRWCGCADHVHPDRSDRSSACRALHTLARRGLVTLEVRPLGSLDNHFGTHGGRTKRLMAKRCVQGKLSLDATVTGGAS